MSQSHIQPAPRRPARPVLCLATVQDLLGIDGDAALELIDNGKLEFAWNISAPQARAREIRVLTESFNAYFENRSCAAKTLAQAVTLVLPIPSLINGNATLRSVTLQKRLGCSQGLVKNLTDSGQLRLAPGQRAARAKTDSPLILHASAVQFLSRRCIGTASYNSHSASSIP